MRKRVAEDAAAGKAEAIALSEDTTGGVAVGDDGVDRGWRQLCPGPVKTGWLSGETTRRQTAALQNLEYLVPPWPHPSSNKRTPAFRTPRPAVDRKLVKQTVMTSVYGVTFVGARAQVGNRLRERGFEDNQFMYKVSCYAAKVMRGAAGCW